MELALPILHITTKNWVCEGLLKATPKYNAYNFWSLIQSQTSSQQITSKAFPAILDTLLTGYIKTGVTAERNQLNAKLIKSYHNNSHNSSLYRMTFAGNCPSTTGTYILEWPQTYNFSEYIIKMVQFPPSLPQTKLVALPISLYGVSSH